VFQQSIISERISVWLEYGELGSVSAARIDIRKRLQPAHPQLERARPKTTEKNSVFSFASLRLVLCIISAFARGQTVCCVARRSHAACDQTNLQILLMPRVLLCCLWRRTQSHVHVCFQWAQANIVEALAGTKAVANLFVAPVREYFDVVLVSLD
jgi:hypothetical protein